MAFGRHELIHELCIPDAKKYSDALKNYFEEILTLH